METTKIAVCSNDKNHKKGFVTTAHIAQDWLIDENGHFTKISDNTTNVIAHLDKAKTWSCLECGADAIWIDDKKSPKGVTHKLGDSKMTLSKPDNIIELKTSTLDSLEYDCFDLFKAYAKAFDITLEATEDEEIDFYTSKQIQDKIIDLFKECGFEIKHEFTPIYENTIIV